MKILVSDLDGTFLEKNGSPPTNSSEFIKFFHKKGFIIIFATARPIGNLKSNILKKNLKPDWVICNDGAIAISFIEDEPTIAIENNLSDLLVKENSSLFRNFGLKPLFFTGSKHSFKVYIPSSTCLEEEQHIKLSDPTRDIIRYDDMNEIIRIGSIRSVSLYGNIKDKTARSVMTANKNKANIMYYKETRFDGKMWLDIISMNADKSKVSLSLAKTVGRFQIDIALGNGLNDLSLINNAVWSSCPNSAIKEIKKIVSFISSEDEGKLFLNDVINQMETHL
ncbi:HAD superfamily hydrolase-like, type 3 domain protein [Candidatus Magnetomorum sp. HK-1]|nr:HAD superfamily hydrolase-like, type 3 domain protein [Candidatus Magnetomorum sp. HK-1]